MALGRVSVVVEKFYCSQSKQRKIPILTIFEQIIIFFYFFIFLFQIFNPDEIPNPLVYKLSI